MPLRLLLPATALLVLLLTAACQPAVREYTSAATDITVKQGERFTIALDGNRTTGYQWQLAQPLDTAIVTLIGSSYQPAGNVPGAGGREVLTFQTQGKGSATIDLEYVRPWEKGTPADKTSRFRVTVE